MMGQAISSVLPAHGRLCGVDYGTVRIGLALSDVEQSLATPFEIYQRRSVAQDADYFRTLAKQERVAGFVVGLPVHGNGGESAKSREARAFAAWLLHETAVPIAFCDERYSTVEAAELLRNAGLKASQRKKQLDKLAAQILLTAFLENRVPSAQAPRPLDD